MTLHDIIRRYASVRLWVVPALIVLAATPSTAFHDGGVGSCSGCHVMHESEDGVTVPVVSDGLLRGLSPSDVCLNCHGQGARAVLGGTPLDPPDELGGGNFIFLFEDQLNDDPRGSAPNIGGHHAGHSIVAPGYGLAADPDYTTSPGGSFPSAELGCTSCHDPHGNTNFRMLYGAGPVQGGLFTFLYDAPDAEGIPLDMPGAVESPTLHTAYRSGVSWWCANCHGIYHDQVGRQTFEHEFNEGLNGSEAERYDSYDGDLNPSGGSHATSYLVEVPFEDPASTIDKVTGPGAGARAMCLTCHRAHATSAPAATRWDMRITRLGQDGVASGSLPLPNPYTDPNQQQLCVKCHDEDHANNSQMSCVLCHDRGHRTIEGYVPGFGP